MESKKINGKNVMLFLDNNVTACATSCSLDITANFSKNASKDSGIWDDMDLDSISYSGSNDAFMVEGPAGQALDQNALFDKLIAGADVPMAFGVPANITKDGVPSEGWTAPTKYYKGTVKITKLSISAPKDGKATYNISFEGCGPLTVVTGA